MKTPANKNHPPLADLKQSLLEKGKLRCVVVSGSMEPVIMTGEHIEVVPLPSLGPRRFDILVFHQHNRLICHTFWNKNELPGLDGQTTWNTFAIAGEGRFFDLPVPVGEVLGLVINRRISTWIRSKVYWQRFKAR